MKKILFLLLLLFTNLICAISYQEYNPNDERFKILALQKAKKRLEISERDFNNATSLLAKNLISNSEFENYKLQYENDKLNFQQYLLSVIFDQPHLTILEAIKSQDSEGNIFVELTLENSSSESISLEDDLIKELKTSSLNPSCLYNVFVSLKDETGSIISQPYEAKIKELENNKAVKVKFSMLKDIESVTVSANYGDRYVDKKILLKRKNEAGAITVIPNLYAQEGESGFSVSYLLNLDYYGESRNRYKLEVEGLPKNFAYEFQNNSNNAIVSDIFLSHNSKNQSLKLKIAIPDKVGDNIELEKAYNFKVNFRSNKNEIVSSTDLELTPTGRSSLELEMNNLFFSSIIGDTVHIYPLKLKNDGLKTLTNIDFDILIPPNWEYKLKPNKIDRLEPEEELKLKLNLIPAKDQVVPGSFQAKIKAEAKSVSRSIYSSEKEIKIELKNDSNPLLTIIIILLAIGLIVVVIYFLNKVSNN